MELGEKIRKIRTEKGFTQKDLAEKLEVSLKSIGNYESGYRKPTPKTLVKLAQLLDVSTTYLSDPHCFDRYAGMEKDKYISQTLNLYGNKEAIDLNSLLEANQAAFAGGELSESQKDKFFQAITEMYFACKEEASKKYGRKNG